jgi:hypothetical protein
LTPVIEPAKRQPATKTSQSRKVVRGVREPLQQRVPAVRRADRVAHLLPAVTVAVEVAVLQLDARPARALGDEADLDLARASSP